VTNVTFIFGTSRNTKPEEKKAGDMAYYIPPPEKVGDMFPVSPTKLRPCLYHSSTRESSICTHPLLSPHQTSPGCEDFRKSWAQESQTTWK